MPGAPGPSIPWLIGVRRKLADHRRRFEREQSGLRLRHQPWREGPGGEIVRIGLTAAHC
jgi:hypothetical protein